MDFYGGSFWQAQADKKTDWIILEEESIDNDFFKKFLQQIEAALINVPLWG